MKMVPDAFMLSAQRIKIGLASLSSKVMNISWDNCLPIDFKDAMANGCIF